MQPKDLWKEKATAWFSSLQNTICRMLESIEKKNGQSVKFKEKEWIRHDTKQPNGDGGKGRMRVLHGDVFEKAGVNISTVFGEFSREFKGQIPGTKKKPEFWASGISLVIHPKNPHVPIIHMNTRLIMTEKVWFGGGIDLTPVFPIKEDTDLFHGSLKSMCKKYNPNFYKDFSKWCKEYFFIKHRNEERGIGGIFYDYQDVDNEKTFTNLFNFTKDVGKTFCEVYEEIVLRNFQKKWTKEDEHQQGIKRSRYVEFNLVYDRGTHFGFKTGGNTEAILMSMPPNAIWP